VRRKSFRIGEFNWFKPELGQLSFPPHVYVGGLAPSLRGLKPRPTFGDFPDTRAIGAEAMFPLIARRRLRVWPLL
jgi:hypothetical protein